MEAYGGCTVIGNGRIVGQMLSKRRGEEGGSCTAVTHVSPAECCVFNRAGIVDAERVGLVGWSLIVTIVHLVKARGTPWFFGMTWS